MKALVCREYGSLDSVALEEIPAPVAGPGQVVLSVAAASVNFPDALMVLGKYQIRPPVPFVPGAEAAGTVTSVGPGVRHLSPGQPVLALPMIGAFAEQVAANAEAVVPLDAAIDPAAAAALPLTYGTVHHALLDRARLQAGETLLVLGAGGGIGIAAVELGKLMGATVIAAASSREKLTAAASRGADHLIDYATEDLRARLKDITGGAGVDVVCDPVGGALSEPALRSTAWRGRYLVVGFAAGDIPRIPLNLPLLKGCSIVGVFWGEFMRREPHLGRAELAQLLEWTRQGRLAPLITRVFPLAEGQRALRTIFERRATGKLLVRP